LRSAAFAKPAIPQIRGRPDDPAHPQQYHDELAVFSQEVSQSITFHSDREGEDNKGVQPALKTAVVKQRPGSNQTGSDRCEVREVTGCFRTNYPQT